MSKRTAQLEKEITRKISEVINQLFPISQAGVFTIRNVYLLPDYSQARIYISRIGGQKDFFEKLTLRSGKIKKEVFSSIKLVKTPDIVFYEDFTGEESQKMEELFKDS